MTLNEVMVRPLMIGEEHKMFNPVQRGYAPEEIASQIESAILLERLNPGDRLQSERELKSSFQASRGTIREALSILKQKGLIKTKRGAAGGAYIAHLTVDKASEGLAFLIRQRRIPFDELAEFRECAESFAAALAAERRTNEGIAQLRAIISEMGDFIHKGKASWKQFYELERMAHETLVSQSGNTILTLVLTTIQSNQYSYTELNSIDDPTGNREPVDPNNDSGENISGREETSRIASMYADWIEIVDALKKREATRLASIIRNHVFRYSKSIRGDYV